VTCEPSARWQELLCALAEEFSRSGALTDDAWRKAFAAVPRHVFVPGFYAETAPPRWIDASDPQWLTGVYSDRTLATQMLDLPGPGRNTRVTSSSTRPGYMLWMLRLLDVADGMNVLEIGTGTGWTAAMLCERLGDDHVTSIDIDPDLIGPARDRLAQAGYRPVLAARNGATGHPGHAPYDRIIATVAVEQIPHTWVAQTRPGGIILADLRPPGMIRAGALVKLTVHGDGTASGPLIDGGVGFMSARSDVAHPAAPDVPAIDKRTVHRRDSELDPSALDNPGWRSPSGNASPAWPPSPHPACSWRPPRTDPGPKPPGPPPPTSSTADRPIFGPPSRTSPPPGDHRANRPSPTTRSPSAGTANASRSTKARHRQRTERRPPTRCFCLS
jgi:protein-L-isoaspartate O-methyltransferase